MPRRPCSYCGAIVGRLTKDHIVPRSAGGPRYTWNLALVCAPCNSLKDDHVMVELHVLRAHRDRLAARGVRRVFPPVAVLRYIGTQLDAMRQGKPFRTLGRGRSS